MTPRSLPGRGTRCTCIREQSCCRRGRPLEPEGCTPCGPVRLVRNPETVPMMADRSLLRSGSETWGPVSPDNVHETGVSFRWRSGSPSSPPRRSRSSELEERPGHGFLCPTRQTPRCASDCNPVATKTDIPPSRPSLLASVAGWTCRCEIRTPPRTLFADAAAKKEDCVRYPLDPRTASLAVDGRARNLTFPGAAEAAARVPAHHVQVQNSPARTDGLGDVGSLLRVLVRCRRHVVPRVPRPRGRLESGSVSSLAGAATIPDPRSLARF
jgi:hypothetical protein